MHLFVRYAEAVLATHECSAFHKDALKKQFVGDSSLMHRHMSRQAGYCACSVIFGASINSSSGAYFGSCIMQLGSSHVSSVALSLQSWQN
jgi:hypothetical protein